MNQPQKSSFRDAVLLAEDQYACFLDQAILLDRLIEELSEKERLEAVPTHMMEMFDDTQWPQLLFEFQPTMALFSADVDLVKLRQQLDQDNAPPTAEQGSFHWLLTGLEKEVLMRTLLPEERELLDAASRGASFDQLALQGWPERDEEGRHAAMTTMLLGWLEERLVVDAGVPLPEDAEYEEGYS